MTAHLEAAATVDRTNPWRAHATRIRDIKPEVPGVTTYELAFEDTTVAEQFRFQPGQFNMLYLPGIGESAISISSDPDEPDRLLHTVRFVGNVTGALARKRIGDQILLRGPFGSSWPLAACRGHDLVIAAGGLGLPPLRPVIHYLVNRREEFGKLWLLYGARTPRDLLFTDQFDAWRAADIHVETTVDLGDDSWTGHIGVVPTLFERLQLDARRTRVFTCGPEIMLGFVVSEALQRKLRPEDIYLSMERNMNCAIGFCGHCQLGPAFVCKDGPIFRYQQMEPYLHVQDF